MKNFLKNNHGKLFFLSLGCLIGMLQVGPSNLGIVIGMAGCITGLGACAGQSMANK